MALDPVSAVLDIGGKLIDRLWPDPAQAAQAKMQLFDLYQKGDLAQLQVDQAEAANPSLFVSGWRPFIGWVCGLSCAWNWIGIPIANAVIVFTGVKLAGVKLAPADLSEMMPVLMGMLGMGGLRTIEKLNKVAAK